MYDKFKRWFGSAAVLTGLALAPGMAWAQTPEEGVEEVVEDDESAEERPWSIEADLTSRVGQGTFVDPANDTEYAEEIDDGSNAWDRANLILTLAPSYQLGDFTLGLELSAVQWLTAAGGQTGSPFSGGANDPQEFAFQDISLSAAWAGHTFEDIGVSVAPNLFADVPTSKASRTNTMLFSLGGEVAVTRTFLDKLNVALVGQGIKYQYSNPNKVVDEEVFGPFRADGGEALGNGQVRVPGYLNTEWIWVAGGAFSFEIIEDLNASLSYMLINYHGFATPEDEFTAEHAEGGRGHTQFVSGVFGLEYGLNEYVTLGAGTYTMQPPLTDDNKSVRFPWWNVHGAADNYSAFTMSVTGTY